MIKNVKRVELNTKAAAAFLERGAFLIYTNLLTMTSISLFYYCEKVFTLINIWMIWENLIEKNLNMEDIIDEDYRHAKSVCKEFKTRNLGYNNDLHV